MLGVVGCDQPDTIELEELCPRIATALCAGRTNCCPEFPRHLDYPAELCPELVENTCRRSVQLPVPKDAVPTPPPLEMDFDKVAAARLVSDFEAAADSCEDPPSLWAVEWLLSVNKRPGDACHSGVECPPGTGCVPNDHTSASGSTCRDPSQGVGAPCRHNGHCATDLGCLLDDGGEIGVCGKGDVGASCDGYVPCLPGLVCKYVPDIWRFQCAPPGAVGAVCASHSSSSGCSEELYCEPSGVDDTSSTGQCAEKLNVGDPCESSLACASNLCDIYQTEENERCRECTEAWCPHGCVDGACPRTVAPPLTFTWPRFLPDEFPPFRGWCRVGYSGKS